MTSLCPEMTTGPFLKASVLAKCTFFESEKNENERFANAFLASIRENDRYRAVNLNASSSIHKAVS